MSNFQCGEIPNIGHWPVGIGPCRTPSALRPGLTSGLPLSQANGPSIGHYAPNKSAGLLVFVWENTRGTVRTAMSIAQQKIAGHYLPIWGTAASSRTNQPHPELMGSQR